MCKPGGDKHFLLHCAGCVHAYVGCSSASVVIAVIIRSPKI